VLTNLTRQGDDGQIAFRRLQRVTDRYLEVVLDHVGDIPEDFSLPKSVQAQRPLLEAFPFSPAAKAFKSLARTANQWPLPDGPSGRIEFFMERMLARPAPRLKVLK
jgi:flagellar biosynthesis protein FlhG